MNNIEEEFLAETSTQKIKPAKRKKSINGKVKGRTFERSIVNLLNKRFPKVNFFRSPGSGSYVGGSNAEKAKKFNQEQVQVFASDVYCSDSNFLYAIECKSYQDLNFHSFFSEKSKLNEFLNQACLGAVQTQKEPMLIIHLNNKPTLVMIPEKREIERLWLCIKYKCFNMLLLEELLQQPDSYFFK